MIRILLSENICKQGKKKNQIKTNKKITQALQFYYQLIHPLQNFDYLNHLKEQKTLLLGLTSSGIYRSGMYILSGAPSIESIVVSLNRRSLVLSVDLTTSG